MVEDREHLGFTLKACEPILVGRERWWQDLDRDLPLQLGIGGPMDLTHAPAADEVDELKHADAGAGSERQTVEV